MNPLVIIYQRKNPIAVFYHALLKRGDPPEPIPAALSIVSSQMKALKDSGLHDACSEMLVGLNGGEESKLLAQALMPPKAKVIYHGLQCHNECRTIRMIEEWLPGHEDWYVLYHHTKGATRPDLRNTHWRECMQRQCVLQWRKCVADLESGYDAVGCHWFTPPFTPPGQYIFAGTFFWAKASYLKTLPSIMARDRIKVSGIDSIESRYESEVWLGNGPVKPRVKDYHPHWLVDAKPHP